MTPRVDSPVLMWNNSHTCPDPAWNMTGDAWDSAASLQLAEARFLADFCCAVYAHSDPKVVCATAARWLHKYFGYQQAHFSFENAELESVYYLPSSDTDRGELASLSIDPFLNSSRSFSFAGSTEGAGVDVTVSFSQGVGELRLLKTEQGRREVSKPFLQSIADCLSSALEKALDHKRLQELSLRDALTGLLNRRAFEDLLEIEEERREVPAHSLVMIDIDNFKAINDLFGHPAGDRVIAAVGAVIRDASRGTDLAARYGGEEYAILLPGTTVTDALAIAERIRSLVLSLKFDFLPLQRNISISLGVAHRHAKQERSLRELLTQADQALYRAKRNGKNVTFVNPLSHS